jgi:hypothetical protein
MGGSPVWHRPTPQREEPDSINERDKTTVFIGVGQPIEDRERV